MFNRRESNRERTLLRLLEAKDRQLEQLLDRIMLLTGQPWNVPPAEASVREPREYVPPEWTATPEQEPR